MEHRRNLRTTRRRRVPIRVALFSIAVVPVSALCLVSWQQVDAAQQLKQDAQVAEQRLDTLADIARVTPELAFAHTYFIGLSAIEDLGLDPSLAVDPALANSTDQQQLYKGHVARLDFIAATLRSMTEVDGFPADGIAAIEALEQFRAGIETQPLTSAQIDSTFEPLHGLLRQFGVATLSAASRSESLAAIAYELDNLEIVSMTNRGITAEMWLSTRLVMEFGLAALGGRSASPERVQQLSVERDEAISEQLLADERLASVTLEDGGELERSLTLLKAQSPGFRSSVDNVIDNVDGAAESLANVIEFRSIFANRLSMVESMSAEAIEVVDHVRDDLKIDVIEEADAANRRLVVLAGAAGASILALVLASLFVSRPAARLARRARELSAGDIDRPALRTNGPRELADAADALNLATLDLSLIGRQAAALVAGNLNADVLRETAPGPLGESVSQLLTQVSQLNADIALSQARATAIVEQAAEAIVILTPDGDILEANLAAESLFGVSEDELIGHSLLDRLFDTPTDDWTAWDDREASLVTANLGSVAVVMSTSRVTLPDYDVVIAIVRDVTERNRFVQQLTELSLRDALTGLPNRRAVLDHLDAVTDAVREEAGELALLYVDLDGFKEVNDLAGHHTGDRVLSEVSQRMVTAVGRRAFVGRLGGDEFLVVLAGPSGTVDELAVAAQILDAIHVPIVDEFGTFNLSASIGTSRWSHQEVSASALLVDADLAVYRAKELGPGQVVVYTEALRTKAKERADVERSFPAAIANGELVMFVQPIVNCVDHSVSSAEVLVRWLRPELGLWMPGQFIPIVESSDLVIDLGREVMRQTCELVAGWERQGRSQLVVSLNMSSRHLANGDPVTDLEQALERSGANPTWLQIEITESHLVDDVDAAIDTLHRLRGLGVKVALDDFGTGYSSLTYLRRLPVHTVKIDRSFVIDVTNRSEDRSIVEMIVALASVLNLAVVAEGVETTDQSQLLGELGCPLQQGYLHARPMPVADFETWWTSYQQAA
jgi:diguanylate cyclase (GGDEF)-like protein/PAS domain S-box-containing protein